MLLEKLSNVLPNLLIRKCCRVCNHKPLDDIVSLGMQLITSFLDSPEKIYAAPLDLVLCNKKTGGCGLVQLKHTVPSDLLYKKFWYKSGVNQTIRNDLADVVNKVEHLIELKPKDIVVDIGSNDSTLLRCYSDKGLVLVGFEPATNLLEEAKVGTTKIFNDFFSYKQFKKEFGKRKAKVVTSISVFYDLEEPNEFVEDIVKMLDTDGVWVIQMNYLMTMLDNNAFDNIVHEHLEYYSLKSLENLLNKHDLQVFDVEQNEINGGSIRTYVKHKDCKKFLISDRVAQTIKYEGMKGLEDHSTYVNFGKRIDGLKKQTSDFIKKEVEAGKKVYIYGASTRGNTLLQFFNLDNKLITKAADKNPNKWGREMGGTKIPIISEEQARKERPDYFLVLPWYFIKEFEIREKKYLEEVGKFIVPLPNFHLISFSHQSDW